MKCTWFCNCAHLQDFSFFVCSLINCATGEFLGGADRKLAAPPAHLQCHGSATVVLYHFTSYTGEQRLAVVMLEAMHSSFSLSFLVLLFFHAHLSMLTAWSTRSWQAGQAQSLGWSCSLSPHLCSAGRAVLDTAMNHSTPGGNYLISHPHSCPSLISLCPAARSLIPALFLVTSTVAVLCPESGAPLCLVLCLPWPWGFHTSCPGAFHFTQAIVL